MISPRYIWTEATGTGRNRYALFRHRFTLKGAPIRGTLAIFADTRYRLIVNGTVLGHGPARFHVRHPLYDTHDLTPFLRRGANVIAVIVNSIGRGTFLTDPSIGGLIAWGEATRKGGRRVRFATGPSWKSFDAPAYSRDTVRLSFALGPAEVLDARQLPAGWELPDFDDHNWPAAVEIAEQTHWGKLAPRSIPLLDEREVLPAACIGSFAAKPPVAEDVYNVVVCSANDHTEPARHQPAALMTYIHSPRAQDITFGAGWGWFWVNGAEVKPDPRTRNKHETRQDFHARLRAGWNSLLVINTLHGDCWDFVLSVPASAQLSLSAERALNSPHTFLLAGPWSENVEQLKAVLGQLNGHEQLPGHLGPWRPWRRDRVAHSPHFARCWEKLTPIAPDAVLPRGSARVFLYDFGTEVLGRPRLDFTAAAGTIVDVLYTERIVDGTALFGLQGTRMAERYVARAGRQTWQTMHPRGMRYLEVIVRGDLDRFALHHLGLTRANYPVRDAGSFACSDPVLNRIWQVGRDTQAVCMEDVFVDCPWRERGLYTGDMLVQYYSTLALFGDHRLMRRCVELFFETQAPDGLLAPCSHGLGTDRHPDYAAVAVQAAWHYWARSGDLAFVRRLKPGIEKLLAGLQTLETPGLPLMDGTGRAPYIDLSRMDRNGINCALNCFYQRALADGARLLQLAGDRRAARQCAKKAAAVAAAIRRGFWSERHGAFVDRLERDVPGSEPSVPANALALLYGIATKPQAARAMQFVMEAMQNNFRVPEPQQREHCNVQAYFSFYALGALYQAGKVVEAEEFIRRHWKWMLDHGAVTWWEYFVDTMNSLCHAWAGCPTHYLSTQVLGVTFPEPGNPNKVLLAPRPGTLQWAAGSYPHPAGPIRVEWQVQGGRISLRYDAPSRVKIAGAGNVDLLRT